MHKKIPVADVEIDSETANILSIQKIHNIEKPLEWEHINFFDCGTSMWYNEFTHNIRYDEDIKLVNSFDWINFNALKDIDIYKMSKNFDNYYILHCVQNRTIAKIARYRMGRL